MDSQIQFEFRPDPLLMNTMYVLYYSIEMDVTERAIDT